MGPTIQNYLNFLLKKYFPIIQSIIKRKGKILIITHNTNIIQLLKSLNLTNFYISTNYFPGIFTNNTNKTNLVILVDTPAKKQIILENSQILIPTINFILPMALNHLSPSQKEKTIFQFFYILSSQLNKIKYAN